MQVSFSILEKENFILGGLLFSEYIVFRFPQSRKAITPIDFSVEGSIIVVREVQPLKERAPIQETPSGSMIEVMEWQLANASKPTDLTLDGMKMEETSRQSLKA